MRVGNSSTWAMYTPPSPQPRTTKSVQNEEQANKPYVFTLESDENLANDTLFQNLLKDTQVQDVVRLNDDGTYSYVSDKLQGFYNNDKVSLAKSLIDGQGLSPYSSSDHSDHKYQTWSNDELALFKQLSGFNLVISSEGSEVIVDDYGNPPLEPGDIKKVEGAYHLMDMASMSRNMGYIDGPLSADNASSVVKLMNLEIDPKSGLTGDHLVDKLLKILAEQKEAASADLQQTDPAALFGEDEKIES